MQMGYLWAVKVDSLLVAVLDADLELVNVFRGKFFQIYGFNIFHIWFWYSGSSGNTLRSAASEEPCWQG